MNDWNKQLQSCDQMTALEGTQNCLITGMVFKGYFLWGCLFVSPFPHFQPTFALVWKSEDATVCSYQSSFHESVPWTGRAAGSHFLNEVGCQCRQTGGLLCAVSVGHTPCLYPTPACPLPGGEGRLQWPQLFQMCALVFAPERCQWRHARRASRSVWVSLGLFRSLINRSSIFPTQLIIIQRRFYQLNAICIAYFQLKKTV